MCKKKIIRCSDVSWRRKSIHQAFVRPQEYIQCVLVSNTECKQLFRKKLNRAPLTIAVSDQIYFATVTNDVVLLIGALYQKKLKGIVLEGKICCLICQVQPGQV